MLALAWLGGLIPGQDVIALCSLRTHCDIEEFTSRMGNTERKYHHTPFRNRTFKMVGLGQVYGKVQLDSAVTLRQRAEAQGCLSFADGSCFELGISLICCFSGYLLFHLAT